MNDQANKTDTSSSPPSKKRNGVATLVVILISFLAVIAAVLGTVLPLSDKVTKMEVGDSLRDVEIQSLRSEVDAIYKQLTPESIEAFQEIADSLSVLYELKNMVSKMYEDPEGYTWGDLDCSEFEKHLGERTKAQLYERIRSDFYDTDKNIRQIQLGVIIYLNVIRPGLKDTLEFECPRWKGCIAQHVEKEIRHLRELKSQNR